MRLLLFNKSSSLDESVVETVTSSFLSGIIQMEDVEKSIMITFKQNATNQSISDYKRKEIGRRNRLG